MLEDNFSRQAKLYAAHRPTYPENLFAYLAGLAPNTRLALDTATGSGQAACGLAGHFQRVIGIDGSLAQLAHAQAHPHVSYLCAAAETLPLLGRSCSLVSAAQALHWFDLDQFYPQVKRVLAPGGIFAAWGYKNPHMTPELDMIINDFYYGAVGAYWSPRVRMVEEGYRRVPFPFEELPVEIEMVMNWSLDDLLGYVRSWSATQAYMRETGRDPLPALAQSLNSAWGGGPEKPRPIRWRLALRVGQA